MPVRRRFPFQTALGLERQLRRMDNPNGQQRAFDTPEIEPIVLTGGMTMIPTAPPPPGREDAILAITAREAREWSFDDLQEEFRRRGWSNPALKNEMAAIRGGVYRLVERNLLEPGSRRGSYRRTDIFPAGANTLSGVQSSEVE